MGEVEAFDKKLCAADLACGSRAQESMQLTMHGRATMLRHGLKAAERRELRLSV
jgi:hypothetical protein